MSKVVSIGWFKQKSGTYALKGITIREDGRAYDSTSTFRDEDARWLTRVLGAIADIELSGSKRDERTPDGYPDWARRDVQEIDSEYLPQFDRERAGAALLRSLLSRMVEACETNSPGTNLNELASEASAALSAIDAGTYYTPEEAHTILDRRDHKTARAKARH